MREANLMNKAYSENRQCEQPNRSVPGTVSASVLGASLPGPIHEKIFEICLGFFEEKKRRGELPKTNQSK